MAKKKKKNIPFHIVHNYKEFELSDGIKFWAKDKVDAELYCQKIKSPTLVFKEIK